MARFLFIVSRGLPRVYEHLRVQFAAEANVEVILDRRVGARPAAASAPAERRGNDTAAEQLRVMGYAFVRIET